MNNLPRDSKHMYVLSQTHYLLQVIVFHYRILVYCSLLHLIYKVYQLERSAAISLSLLNLGPERKVKCYNRYFVNGMSFILKNMVMEERHTITVFVLRDRLLVSLKLTTMVD